MSCLSLLFLKELIIDFIIIAAIVAILKLFIPMLTSLLGSWGTILARAINIILWAIIAILVVVIIFDLLSCLMGGIRLRG